MFGPILLQLYGTTESGRITFLDPAGQADAGLAATVGRVFPEVEVEVRDPAGQLGPLTGRLQRDRL